MAATVAGLLAGLAAPVRADRPPAPVELSEDVRGRLEVLHDGRGHYVLVEPFGDTDHVFYGNGQRLHRQRVLGSFHDRSAGKASLRFWAPNSANHGDLALEAGGRWVVRCDERRTPLVSADEAEAERVRAEAKLFEPKWQRRAYALARDETGRYYYVDRLQSELATGFRLFVGKRGAMKAQRLTDVVSDSAGDVFATRRGELRLSRTRDGAAAVWQRGGRRIELTPVPVEKNVVLVYAELGVYRDSLGTPCDIL